MTLAMMLMLFKANKWFFLMLFISSGFALWGINILIRKLLGNNDEE